MCSTAAQHIYCEAKKSYNNNDNNNKKNNMAASAGRLAKASSGQQNRLTAEERTSMELWLSMEREYKHGKGKSMTNLRWINGAASKGLTNVSGDPKQAKQVGAQESLALFVNTKLKYSGSKSWTAAIAHNKWKNMKLSFKRVLTKFPTPDDAQWERDGKSKEEFAAELERITSARRAACQSYDILWPELKDHPSIHPACQYESDFQQNDEEGDAEQDEEGNEEQNFSEEGSEEDEDVTVTKGKSSKSSGTGSASKGSPKGKSPRHKKGKSSVKSAPVKMSLKKSSEQPRHRDITAAYISMKAEWNRMWLRTMMLKQRQEVYFMCLDRSYNRQVTNQILMDLGLGRIPAFMDSWDDPQMNDTHEHVAAMRTSDAVETMNVDGSNIGDDSGDGDGSRDGDGDDSD
jgi:hypothetical protein